jgi:ABC-type amino acid transport substrate-binding protein
MEPLFIAASPTSPEIDFRFDQHTLSIKGESYPENAAAFYGPVIARVQAYLDGCADAAITVNVSLAYFNSSSTKMLFSFFEALNEAALAGNQVRLNWYHDEDDDTILEFGQELRDDFGALDFHDHAVSG